MSVDVTHVDGPTDRGFGLVIGLDDEGFYTYEVTPWQDLDLWHWDNHKTEWFWVNGIFSGAVKVGGQTNRITADVSENSSGRLDISLSANGRTPLVIFNRSAKRGWVGLTLYGHAVELMFDNFHFETEETPAFPTGAGSTSG